MKLIVVGGKLRPIGRRLGEWAHAIGGVIVEADLLSGNVRKTVEYPGNPEYMPDQRGSSTLFKAASLNGDRLLACTTTEILEYDVTTWRVTRTVSHPWFNDVHHVIGSSTGTLWVANTGLDMVMELNWQGECLRHFFIADGSDWRRFSQNIDYRKVPSTKPHISHPNFVREHDGDIWVTRFSQQDAICVTNPGRPLFRVETGHIHDGILRHGDVWFTAVNGYLSVHDQRTGAQLKQVDLNRLGPCDRALGWCRSIEVLSTGQVIVGFSRLRPTRIKENLLWLSRKIKLRNTLETMPTRLWVLDADLAVVESEILLETADLNAVFSIHAVSDHFPASSE